MKAAILCALALHAASAPPRAAKAHLRAGRYAQAIAAARAAGGPGGLTLAGRIERRLGRFTEARRTLEEVVQKWPVAAARARLELGLAALETGDQARAETLLDQFYQDFNAGRVDTSSAQALAEVAMAARA